MVCLSLILWSHLMSSQDLCGYNSVQKLRQNGLELTPRCIATILCNADDHRDVAIAAIAPPTSPGETT